MTIIAGLVAPPRYLLVGMLMFGNLLRECLKLDSLSQTAQTTLANLITILLGLTISFTMRAEQFLTVATIVIMALGLVAFVFDTIGGVLFAKLMNLFLPEGKKINPMVGGAGISAFPMSARVIQKMALKEDNQNHLLMHAVGANVAGQIGSVVAGGIIPDGGSPPDRRLTQRTEKGRMALCILNFRNGEFQRRPAADAAGHGRHFRGHGAAARRDRAAE